MQTPGQMRKHGFAYGKSAWLITIAAVELQLSTETSRCGKQA